MLMFNSTKSPLFSKTHLRLVDFWQETFGLSRSCAGDSNSAVRSAIMPFKRQLSPKASQHLISSRKEMDETNGINQFISPALHFAENTNSGRQIDTINKEKLTSCLENTVIDDLQRSTAEPPAALPFPPPLFLHLSFFFLNLYTTVLVRKSM